VCGGGGEEEELGPVIEGRAVQERRGEEQMSRCFMRKAETVQAAHPSTQAAQSKPPPPPFFSAFCCGGAQGVRRIRERLFNSSFIMV
jgi:hypothetical protein